MAEWSMARAWKACSPSQVLRQPCPSCFADEGFNGGSLVLRNKERVSKRHRERFVAQQFTNSIQDRRFKPVAIPHHPRSPCARDVDGKVRTSDSPHDRRAVGSREVVVSKRVLSFWATPRLSDTAVSVPRRTPNAPPAFDWVAANPIDGLEAIDV